MAGTGGFKGGFIIGAAIALTALMLSTPAEITTAPPVNLTQWLMNNLGHSLGLFSVVAVLFGIKLQRLLSLLEDLPDPIEPNRHIVALDQMLDVWTQVFIGIGVVWTAVGMRSALQTALGDPNAALNDDADAVLRRLVDGGILLALTTTIVGAVGGYIMRVIKTACVGAALQAYYEGLERQEIRTLVAATNRIEAHLQRVAATYEVSPINGRGS